MTNTAKIRALPGLSFFALGLAAVMLAAFIPVPRAQAISSMPWKAELVSGIVCILLAVVYRPSGPPRGARTMLYLGGAFILWSFLSAIWAPSFGWTLHHTLTWLIYFAIFGISMSFNRGTLLSGAAAAFGAVAFILAANAVIDLATIGDFMTNQGTVRIRYGKFAEMVLTFTPMLCAAAWYARGRMKVVLGIAWLAGWLLVMLSLSKGAFLSGIAAHIILFAGCLAFSQRVFRKTLVRSAIIWVVFTVVIQAGFSVMGTIPSTTDYITGAADKTRETSVFRTFSWRVGLEMVRLNPVIGVGADNFGIAFNDARTVWARANQPAGPEMAEDYIVERAHNEFLQIFAELGVIGAGLIAALATAFLFAAWSALRRNGGRLSPVFWAAFAGMAGFIASSMVSSFSFRAIQNGVVFFVVLAIAVREISAKRRPETSTSKWTAITVATCILMTLFAGSKAVGEFQIYRAERVADFAQASSLYESSLTIDPDNAPACYYLAHRVAVQTKNLGAAAGILREGIDRGVGMTLTYSKLSTYYEQAGDTASAKKALAEAVGIFPRSVFVRVRYADLLHRLGEEEAATSEMAAASAIDGRQAAGWLALIRDGSVAAFQRSGQDARVAPPAELRPAGAVPEFMDDNPLSAQ